MKYLQMNKSTTDQQCLITASELLCLLLTLLQFSYTYFKISLRLVCYLQFQGDDVFCCTHFLMASFFSSSVLWIWVTRRTLAVVMSLQGGSYECGINLSTPMILSSHRRIFVPSARAGSQLPCSSPGVAEVSLVLKNKWTGIYSPQTPAGEEVLCGTYAHPFLAFQCSYVHKNVF